MTRCVTVRFRANGREIAEKRVTGLKEAQLRELYLSLSVPPEYRIDKVEVEERS